MPWGFLSVKIIRYKVKKYIYIYNVYNGGIKLKQVNSNIFGTFSEWSVRKNSYLFVIQWVEIIISSDGVKNLLGTIKRR